MKNSNKLLLGGFLTVILLISAIHITLYAKYRSGDYTIYNDDLQSMVMQSFPHVKFVSISNVANVAVRFSDSMKVEKLEGNEIRYTQRGDTLHIAATDTSAQNRYWDEVTINIPPNATLYAFNTMLTFKSIKKGEANNSIIYLDKSEAVFSSTNEPMKLASVNVTAVNNSRVTFGKTVINNLQVRLLNSSIETDEAIIDQLSIKTDSLSRLSLNAKHFSKAKLETTIQEY